MSSLEVRLNREKGFAHVLLLMAVVVIVAVIGGYYVIASHADASAQSIVGLGGKCLDNLGNVKANSNKINLSTCKTGDSQKWTIGSDGSIKNANGYCLDVKGASKAEYTFVQLYQCNSTVAQKWKVDSTNKYLINTNTGYCVTVQYAATIDGTPLWMKGCHATAAQKWTVQAKTGSPTTPTPTPTASNCSSTQPSGSGLTAYQSLSGSTFASKVNSNAGRTSLASGTYSFSNFIQNPVNGNSLVGAAITNGTGIIGSGIDRSIIQMNPNTSDKASRVPTATGTTNQLTLLYFNKPNIQLSCFTLQGTNQGHLYNGLTMNGVLNAKLSNLKFKGASPGNKNYPPGETFTINDYKGTNNTYTNVEVDGADVGASGFAGNSTSGGTWENAYAHDNPYGAGIALWQMTGTQTLTNFKSVNNFIGINLERDNSTVNVIKPTISGTKKYDVYLGNDWGSTKLNIYDPILDPGKKLIIFYPLNGTAGPSKQLKSDVHIYVNGVDKTDAIASFIGR